MMTDREPTGNPACPAWCRTDHTDPVRECSTDLIPAVAPFSGEEFLIADVSTVDGTDPHFAIWGVNSFIVTREPEQVRQVAEELLAMAARVFRLADTLSTARTAVTA